MKRILFFILAIQFTLFSCNNKEKKPVEQSQENEVQAQVENTVENETVQNLGELSQTDTQIAEVEYHMDYDLGDYNELPLGTDGTAGTEARYVTFGLFPQTIKSKDVTVDENTFITTDCGIKCYLGSDGYYYVPSSVVSSSGRSYSSVLTEGEVRYYQNYYYSDGTLVDEKVGEVYFKLEPIKWLVLTDQYIDAEGKKLTLLLSERILNNIPNYNDYSSKDFRFYDAYGNYKDGRYRAYLNNFPLSAKHEYSDDEKRFYTNKLFVKNGFLHNAFTEWQAEKIYETAIANDIIVKDSNYEMPEIFDEIAPILPEKTYIQKDSSRNTKDKIFLLSFEEAIRLFDVYSTNDSPLRQREVTDYSLAHNIGRWSYDKGDVFNCAWVLRTYYDSDVQEICDLFFSVFEEGEIGLNGDAGENPYFEYAPNGIVPALCIEVD